MSVGLPGLGLGGLFFVLSALLAPFVELIRTARGRSSLAAWRAVGRQFALALTVVAAVVLTFRLLYALTDATGLAGPLSELSPTVLAQRTIGITLGLLACVLAAAKAMQLVATIRTGGGSPVASFRALSWRPRLLGRLGAVTAVCLMLLLVGPSELAHTPAGGKAAVPDQAPGPLARTPGEASPIEAAVERGSGVSGSPGRPVRTVDSAARQTGSDSLQRAAAGGGDSGDAAPPPSGHRGRGRPRTPQPSPPAAAPPPARALPDLGSAQTSGSPQTPDHPQTPGPPQTPDRPQTQDRPQAPGRPQTQDRPRTPDHPQTPSRPQTPASPPAVGVGGGPGNAAAESGQPQAGGGGWGRTGTPPPSRNEAGTPVE